MDRERTQLGRSGSGSYSRQLGRWGGCELDALTRVTNEIWAHGWAVMSGRGQSLTLRFLVQQLPELRGELSLADVGCFSPKTSREKPPAKCFLIWTQTPVPEVRALCYFGGVGGIIVTLGMLLSTWN